MVDEGLFRADSTGRPFDLFVARVVAGAVRRYRGTFAL